MTKKRFGLTPALNKGLSETVQLAEHERIFRTIFVPIDQIEPDENNPRKMHISESDLHGIDKKDPLFELKQVEFEKLETLANSIKNDGLLNPIIIYKNGNKYKIVAGERRYLSSILAGKKEIESRVFESKPTNLALKVVQWVENTEREDLSLSDRIENIREIVNAASQENQIVLESYTGEMLSKITGVSIRQAQAYLSILRSSKILHEAIKEGFVKSIEKAVVISSIESENAQLAAIDACANGANISELKKVASLSSQEEKQRKQEFLLRKSEKKPTSSSEASKIKVGTIENIFVVKEIVESVLKNPKYQIYTALFSDINWNDVSSVTKCFRKMLSVIEEASLTKA